MKKQFENYALYLRALQEEDYKYSIRWRQDEEIWNMVVGPRYYVSEEYEKQWVKNRIESQTENLTLVVCEKETDVVLGYIYLTNIDYKNKNALFGKLLGEKSCWGKGYGTQATMLMLYHAFYELGLERVYAWQLMENNASIRVNQKCGFKNEGIMRNAVYKNGAYRDLNLMAVLRDEFDELLKEV